MMPEISKELERENFLVSCLMQAAIGLISPEIRFISLVPRQENVTLLFILDKESPEPIEDVEEIASDYSASTLGYVDHEYDISIQVIGERALTREDIMGRPIYMRKPLTKSSAQVTSSAEQEIETSDEREFCSRAEL